MKHQYFFFEGRPKMERLSKMMGGCWGKCHTLATNVITQSRSTHLTVEVGPGPPSYLKTGDRRWVVVRT